MVKAASSVKEKVIRLEKNTFESALTKAVEVLNNGGVVALPTDTVYGVTALLRHSDSLYQIKRRNPEKPLGLFITDVQQVNKWASQTVDMPTLRRLLPGPSLSSSIAPSASRRRSTPPREKSASASPKTDSSKNFAPDSTSLSPKPVLTLAETGVPSTFRNSPICGQNWIWSSTAARSASSTATKRAKEAPSST